MLLENWHFSMRELALLTPRSGISLKKNWQMSFLAMFPLAV